MQKITLFTALFLLFQPLFGQNAKWVFKEKDGSKRIEIQKGETVEIVWRTDDARSVSTISADFFGIQNDSIWLENSAGQAFARPLKEARSIKATVAGGGENSGRRTAGWTVFGGGILLWLIGFGIFARIFSDAANSSSGTTSASPEQSFGCCLTTFLGLAAIITGLVVALSSGAKKSHSEVIDSPARNWTIKKVEIP